MLHERVRGNNDVRQAALRETDFGTGIEPELSWASRARSGPQGPRIAADFQIPSCGYVTRAEADRQDVTGFFACYLRCRAARCQMSGQISATSWYSRTCVQRPPSVRRLVLSDCALHPKLACVRDEAGTPCRGLSSCPHEDMKVGPSSQDFRSRMAQTMAVQFAVLSSGSRGNSTLICGKGAGLVD